MIYNSVNFGELTGGLELNHQNNMFVAMRT